MGRASGVVQQLSKPSMIFQQIWQIMALSQLIDANVFSFTFHCVEKSTAKVREFYKEKLSKSMVQMYSTIFAFRASDSSKCLSSKSYLS